MRQRLTRADEPFLFVRTLGLNYAARSYQSEHGHIWPQLLYARSGAIRADVADRRWLVPPRRALWIPAGLPHSFTLSSNFELRTLYLRPDQVVGLEVPRIVAVNGLLHELILHICARDWLDTRDGVDRNLGAVLLDELAQAGHDAPSLILPRDSRARKLADRFTNPDLADTPLAELLAQSGLGKRTAERLFFAETGLPPAPWRRLALLSEAMLNIAGGMPIDHAALASGYQSRSAFTDAFGKTFGFSPGSAR